MDRKGGVDDLADYCSIPNDATQLSGMPNELCTDMGSSVFGQELGAKHCQECRCFEVGETANPICLPAVCSKDGELSVTVLVRFLL